MDSNLQTMSTDMDNIVASFGSDETAFMELTGQAATPKSEGLSRLNINYDTETEDGETLTRGDWKMMYLGEMVYAKEILIKPILRTFEWSIFDAEQGVFSSKSVQKPTMSGDFPDTEGGNNMLYLPLDKPGQVSSGSSSQRNNETSNEMIDRVANEVIEKLQRRGNQVQSERRR